MHSSTGTQFTLSLENADISSSIAVIQFECIEKLSQPYQLTIDIQVDSYYPLELNNIIEQPMVLKVFQDGILDRLFHAVVFDVEIKHVGDERISYTLVGYPSLFKLSHRRNTRLFQSKNVKEIIQHIVEQEHNIRLVDFTLKRKMKTREFLTQRSEDDLRFIQRIAAQEGLSFYFTHTENNHELHFVDDNQAFPEIDEEILYNPEAGGMGEMRLDASNSRKPWIYELHYRLTIASNKVTQRDRYFKNPNYKQEHISHAKNVTGISMAEIQNDYESYQYPGSYKDSNTGDAFTHYEMDYLRRDTQQAKGKSNQVKIQTGHYFVLDQHPLSQQGHPLRWLASEVVHVGTQPQAAKEASGGGATTYNNRFVAAPSNMQWRADPIPKPLLHSTEIAVVTGPPGEEIWIDEFGRCTVQFAWDREGKFNEKSSCWIRVASNWSGGRYGFTAHPRIGNEVLISYVNGDPDQPIITAMNYNAASMQAYPQPANKTKTYLRTNSHQTESKAYNELCFDDATESEMISLRAQKDMDVYVINSKNERVDYNRTTSIGHDEELVIANDRKVTVEANQDHKTTLNFSELIGEDKSLIVEGDSITKVDGNKSIKVEGELVIDSDTKITLRHGSNYIVLGPSGIEIQGTTVKINQGATPGMIALPMSPAILKAAAGNGSLFVKQCPKKLEEQAASLVAGSN